MNITNRFCETFCNPEEWGMLHDAPEIKSRDVPANFKEKNKVSGPNRKKSEQFGKKKLGDKKKKVHK